ncbi:MAG: hypothetical protein H9893_06220 [Candidatus Niameybacter stercoravium]|nr:hypothetical protein [Candidatus Niameybacter stercoravium]
MRLGELVALKWDNVNFDDNTILVCESYRRTTKYNAEAPLKELWIKRI